MSRSRPRSMRRISIDSFKDSDPEGHIWTYLGYGPFADLASFRRGCKEREAARDPWFYAFVRRDTGKAAGMGAFMRLDAANGVIEIGHIWMSPALAANPRGDRRHLPDDAPRLRRSGRPAARMEMRFASTRPRARRRSASASPSRAFSASISSSRAATATPPGFRSSTRNGRRSGRRSRPGSRTRISTPKGAEEEVGDRVRG